LLGYFLLQRVIYWHPIFSEANYPRVKRRFRPPGQHKFLFIGTGAPYKKFYLLSILFGRAAGREARGQVERNYTFERFTNTVLGALRELGVG
jgi:hypothetical protein